MSIVIITDGDLVKWEKPCVSGKAHLCSVYHLEDQSLNIEDSEVKAPLFSIKCMVCDLQGAFNLIHPF